MLLRAGVRVDAPLLPKLFRVGLMADSIFCFLEAAVQPNALPQPSSKLLVDIAARTAHFASWSNTCLEPREEVSLTRLLSCQNSDTHFGFMLQGYPVKSRSLRERAKRLSTF